jgi:glycosyltransferase involved in cell wall biosynthesis
MRILYDHQIFSNAFYGGIARYFIEMAVHIASYPKVDLTIIAPLNRSSFLKHYQQSIPLWGLDASGLKALPQRVTRPLNGMIFDAYAKCTSPDLVHETYYAPPRIQHRSYKIVTTMHDLIPERFPQYFPAVGKHIAERKSAILRADHIICVSESTRSDLLHYYDVGDKNISVIPLGSSLEWPRDLSRVCDSPYFLQVGGRYPYKNFEKLIQAFASSGLYRSHKLVTFSAHPLSRKERETIESVKIPQGAILELGGDDQMLSRCYCGAVSLVYPSLHEGFGIPLLEAMRCNCPIITSNVSSLPEIAGDAALYCDPNDVESIAHCMLTLASSEQERSRLVMNGRHRVERYTWEACAERTYEVYCQTIAGGDRPTALS